MHLGDSQQYHPEFSVTQKKIYRVTPFLWSPWTGHVKGWKEAVSLWRWEPGAFRFTSWWGFGGGGTYQKTPAGNRRHSIKVPDSRPLVKPLRRVHSDGLGERRQEAPQRQAGNTGWAAAGQPARAVAALTGNPDSQFAAYMLEPRYVFPMDCFEQCESPHKPTQKSYGTLPLI